MKNQLLLTVMLAFAGTAWSQTENDDLYYSAKDRQRENDSRPKINRTITSGQESIQDIFGDDSPTLSRRNRSEVQYFDGAYSGRSFNPDFDPNSNEEVTEDYEYFTSSYAPLGINNRLYDRYNDPSFPSTTFNNAWNNPYRNSFYGSGFGAWGYNRFYDPFYAPFGNSFNSFGSFYDPFYGSGCFSCFSPGWGNGFGSSWFSMSYGFNSFGWNNPSWGYGYSSWNRPNMIIINQYDRYPRVVYGKRPSRSINSNNDAQQNIRNSRAVPAISGSGSRSNQSGRSSGDRTTNYYNRGWRQEAGINSQSGSSSQSKSSGWSNRSSSGWPSDNSSRSSSGFGSGGNNRSSGFSGGGFSSGSGSSSSGARRGRN